MKPVNRTLSTTQIIALGFFLAIIVGTILLCLPACSSQGNPTPPLDALFTATSAVCVTGLVVVNTASHWSTLGQVVILLLVQLGGLGIVSFTTAIMMVIGRRITLRDRLLLEDALNLNTLSGLVAFLQKILKGTFLAEAIGFLCYLPVFVPQFGIKGVWYSLFNAVSAFCNAGMDIIGDNSLMNYVTHPWINLVTMSLIILGGIGFIVWMDIGQLLRNLFREKKSWKYSLQHLRLHTKIVLITTLCLIFGGAFLILILEYHNPETIGSLSFPGKVLASLFQSVTTRTAGFLTIPQESMYPTTALICLILMFIGGSSIGTAGGIKTSTAALLILSAWSTVKGDRHLVLFQKNIPHSTIKKALAVTMASMLILLTSILILYHQEGGSLLDLTYEATSAIATVGLSRDLTASLHMAGKSMIILLMYLGRIGPISMAIIFGRRLQKAVLSYPVEDITIG